MIYVGVDVAGDEHDCFIINSDREILFHTLTISDNHEGSNTLFQRIESVSDDSTKVKVGLKAVGHYNYNLLRFLPDRGLSTYVINPLHTSLYGKSLTLRRTKTGKVDSCTIATMIVSDTSLKSCSDISYHNEELKSLIRYHFDKVKERAELKTSISRLVNILFPELEKLISSLHPSSVYASLSEFPGATQIAASHLTKLTNLLSQASRGRYEKEATILFRETARSSIGSAMPAKSLELKHTIKLIQELTTEIDEVEVAIKRVMDEEIHSSILMIPGISYRIGAMIPVEIGDSNRFDSIGQIFTCAGMSPSTYQSGQLNNCCSYTEKCGSCYLWYTLYSVTKYVCQWDESFSAYLVKKRSEGKRYDVALPHATEKLVRLISAVEKSGRTY